MQHLIDAIRKSVQDKNWYAALTGALALPDIAGKLDGRGGGSQARYVSWFDDYLLSTYTTAFGDGTTHVFLSGNDCYALRCAYLHEGEFNIQGQRARDVLERFQFVVPKQSGIRHRNQINLTLQLQVDCFCDDVCVAAENWLRARGQNLDVAAAIAGLPRIEFF